MASAATDGGLRGLSVMTVPSVCTPYLWCGQTPPWPPSTPPSAPTSTLGGGSAFFTPHLSWGTLADRAMLSTDAGVHPLSAAVQRGSHAKRPCSLCRTCSHGRYALPYALVCCIMRLYALICARTRPTAELGVLPLLWPPKMGQGCPKRTPIWPTSAPNR